jgi:hypothetical protein
MKKRTLILCWLLALAHPMGAAAASVLAVDINPTTRVPDSLDDPVPPGDFFGFDEVTLVTNGMYGWGFMLAEPATVTGLAWYDQNPAGLSHAHEVGVWWDPGGSTNWYVGGSNYILLFSLTIPAGTNAILLSGAWRKVDLPAPVALPAAAYTLAGTYYSGNPDVVKFVRCFGDEGIPMDPRIIVEGPVFTDSGTRYGQYDPNAPLFQMPDNTDLAYGFDFGPNLLLVPPVPSLQVSASGHQIVLSWPLWATNYVLETSAATGPAASWTAMTNAAAVSGESLVVTNPMSTPSAFYRLRQR